MEGSKRNYNIREIQSYHDYILLTYLLYILHVDIVPTEMLILGGAFFLIFKAQQIKRTHEPINGLLLAQINAEISPPKTVKFYKANKESDASSALSLGYKTCVLLESRIYHQDELTDYARCVIQHEIAHATRNDTFVKTLYTEISRYLLYAVLFSPIIYFIAPKHLLPAGSTFFLFILFAIFENGPAFYLYATRNRYLYRREFIADSTAHQAIPKRFFSFLKQQANEERQQKRFSKDNDDASSNTHPPFQERLEVISGGIKPSFMTIFWHCLIAGLFSVYAAFTLATSFTNDPNATVGSPEIKKIIGAVLLYFYFKHLMRIVSIVTNLRNNGLSIQDKLAGTSAILLGLYAGPFFFNLLILYKTGATDAVYIYIHFVISMIYWVALIFPVFTLMFTSFFFKIKFPFFVGLLGLGAGYFAYDTLNLINYDSFQLDLISLSIVFILLLLVGPLGELIARASVGFIEFLRSYIGTTVRPK